MISRERTITTLEEIKDGLEDAFLGVLLPRAHYAFSDGIGTVCSAADKHKVRRVIDRWIKEMGLTDKVVVSSLTPPQLQEITHNLLDAVGDGAEWGFEGDPIGWLVSRIDEGDGG